MRFLWVAFQIDSICHENTDNDILHTIQNLPKDLPSTFGRILRRLEQSKFANLDMVKKILEIVVVAQRPLILEELWEVISIILGKTSW